MDVKRFQGARADRTTVDFCLGLYEKSGAFLAPGSFFGLEGPVRIGYACDSEVFRNGLKMVSDYLRELEERNDARAYISN